MLYPNKDVDFNLNGGVFVKLDESEKQILRKYYESKKASYGWTDNDLEREMTESVGKNDGYTQFQMIDLLNIFGSSIKTKVADKMPFGGEFRFDTGDLQNIDSKQSIADNDIIRQ
jgi:hypothetical protein